MLTFRNLAAWTLITASFTTASPCLDSFTVVQPTYVRYQGIPIKVTLNYDPTLCPSTSSFDAVFSRSDGAGNTFTNDLKITAHTGSALINTQVNDYSWPKSGGFNMRLKEDGTGNVVNLAIQLEKKGDYDRCMGQLGFYGSVDIESDGTVDGDVFITFQGDVDFCAGITSPSSSILGPDTSVSGGTGGFVEVARCGAVDLGPDTIVTDPHPMFRLRCSRTRSFDSVNGGYIIRFNLVSDDPLNTTPGVGERAVTPNFIGTTAEEQCVDGLEVFLPPTIIRDSTKQVVGTVRYPAVCAGMTFQLSTTGTNEPNTYCDRLVLSGTSGSAQFSCAKTEGETQNFNGFYIGYINDFVATEFINYHPTIGDNPDEEGCASALQITRDGVQVFGATLDYLTTDTSLFKVDISYPLTGICDQTMFVDYRLRNSEKEYTCTRFTVDNSGAQSITCQRVVGTMATYVTWELNPFDPTARSKRDRMTTASNIIFSVSHADNPGQSGVPRKRAVAGQAAYSYSGEFQCLPGLTACAIPGSKGLMECLNTRTNLEVCGGCPRAGGVDCTEIPGVGEVACVAGKCSISSCDEKYSFSAESNACVAMEILDV